MLLPRQTNGTAVNPELLRLLRSVGAAPGPSPFPQNVNPVARGLAGLGLLGGNQFSPAMLGATHTVVDRGGAGSGGQR